MEKHKEYSESVSQLTETILAGLGLFSFVQWYLAYMIYAHENGEVRPAEENPDTKSAGDYERGGLK